VRDETQASEQSAVKPFSPTGEGWIGAARPGVDSIPGANKPLKRSGSRGTKRKPPNEARSNPSPRGEKVAWKAG
jgi:hypothetical protein